MAMDIEGLYAALPDVIGDDAALDRVLRHIGRIAEGDGAKLGLIRRTVIDWRLVVSREDGVIVKGSLPQAKSFVEAENERIAALAKREREEFADGLRRSAENLAATDPSRPLRERFERLETQIGDLRGQVEALQQQIADMQVHEVAA